VARDDDTPEALAARLRDYHEKTKPVLALFERKEFVADFDATQPIEAVQAQIRTRFGLPAPTLTPPATAPTPAAT
jgi:adenylate kinase